MPYIGISLRMQFSLVNRTIEKCRTCSKLSLDCVQIEEASLLVIGRDQHFLLLKKNNRCLCLPFRVTGSDSSIDLNVLCCFPENDPKQNLNYLKFLRKLTIVMQHLQLRPLINQLGLRFQSKW